MARKLSLSGAVVLITGAGQGIGLEMTREALRRGATPIAVDMNGDLVAALNSELQGRGSAHTADVCDSDAMNRIVADAIETHGRIDVVIANAGIERLDPTPDMPRETFEMVINVNVLGVYRTLKPALDSVIENKGHILGVSSLAGLVPFPIGTAYSASKAGVDMMMRALRMELTGTGATAGAAYFGFVKTDMAGRVFSQKPLADALNRLPQRLLGAGPNPTPEAVARRVLDGVERRKQRVVVPRMVGLTYLFKGFYAPLDDLFARHILRMNQVIRDLRAAKSGPV